MSGADRAATGTGQSGAAPPAAWTGPEHLARRALLRRPRQAETFAGQRRAAGLAEEDGPLDGLAHGPVPVDVTSAFLHGLRGGEIEPAVVVANHAAR